MVSKNPSVMSHQFSQVPRVEIPRSSFDRSHGHKTTLDAGILVPVYCDEALPGDTFNMSLTAFARMATPIFPVMDNMIMDVHFFAVPHRLIWDNWNKFCGEQVNPGDSTDYLVPTMTSPAGGYLSGSLHDYLGLPVLKQGLVHSSLFHRAYNLVYNQWYRDENLAGASVVDRDDGPDNPSDYVLLRRGKRHDYFTSCLPWPQKGSAVSIPLGSTAPVNVSVSDLTKQVDFKSDGAATALSAAAGTVISSVNGASVTGQFNYFNPFASITADLSSATAATINQLRQSYQVQRLLERDARGGSRYTEIVRSHFGVISPDARLQRPEFLGGGSMPVNINQIPQTSSTDATTPQGNLAAYGTVNGQVGFTKSFTEHCVIIGLVSVRADLTYQQGLNRMFSRSTRYDYYWPALSHIGEQAVLRKEIYATGVPVDDDVVFGYQERYAEYRYKPSQITGLFRSVAVGSLDAWHLSQEFGPAAPVLNATFIEENPPVDRVIAVPSQPHFLFDSYFKLHCARPMPIYGVPGFVDHF